jgi:hypothetical protein
MLRGPNRLINEEGILECRYPSIIDIDNFGWEITEYTITSATPISNITIGSETISIGTYTTSFRIRTQPIYWVTIILVILLLLHITWWH